MDTFILGVIGILMLILIVLFVVCIMVYSYMSPFIPYIIAKLMKKDLLIVFQSNGLIRLVPATYNSNIYTVDSDATPWTFVKKDTSLLRIGDVPACLCVDSWAVTVNPKLILSIQELYKIGIPNFERLKDQLEYERMEIEMAKQQQRPINTEIVLLTGSQLRMNSFDIINFDVINDFAWDATPTIVTAAIRDEISERIMDYKDGGIVDQKSSFDWTWIVIGGGLLLCIAIGAKSMGYI